jgi:hypothetical protein
MIRMPRIPSLFQQVASPLRWRLVGASLIVAAFLQVFDRRQGLRMDPTDQGALFHNNRLQTSSCGTYIERDYILVENRPLC